MVSLGPGALGGYALADHGAHCCKRASVFQKRKRFTFICVFKKTWFGRWFLDFIYGVDIEGQQIDLTRRRIGGGRATDLFLGSARSLSTKPWYGSVGG